MLVAMWHSGSRTLRKHLSDEKGIKEHLEYSYHVRQFPEGVRLVSKYKTLPVGYEVPKSELIDTAVRDPLSHIVSWKVFIDSGESGDLSFFTMWQLWWDFLQGRKVKYHKIEDLEVLRGFGPIRKHPLRAMLKEKDFEGLRRELPEFFVWLERKEVRGFYEQFYELSYLN